MLGIVCNNCHLFPMSYEAKHGIITYICTVAPILTGFIELVIIVDKLDMDRQIDILDNEIKPYNMLLYIN